MDDNSTLDDSSVEWEGSSSSSSSVNDSVIGLMDPTESYSLMETIALSAVLLVIIVGTIVGNILVCVAVCLVRRLRRPCNYLLVSLAVSDLCVALLVMPVSLVYEVLGTWPFGATACDAWVAFDVLSCTASILNLCMISVDRYYAITRPLDYGVKRTPTRMLCCVALVWISSACISLPPLLVLGNDHGKPVEIDAITGQVLHPGRPECNVCQEFGYQIYATLGSFYIPLGVMAAVYYQIFQAAKRIVDEEMKAQSHLLLTRASSQRLKQQQQQQQQQQRQPPPSIAIDSSAINGHEGRNQLVPVGSINESGGSWPDVCSAAGVDATAADTSGTSSSSPELTHSRANSKKNNRRQEQDTCLIAVDGQYQQHIGNRPATAATAAAAAATPSSVVQQQQMCQSKVKLRFALNKERKASTTLGIIMSAFTLCWLPFFVLALVRPFGHQLNLVIPHWLSSLFLWLGYANSFLNPVIYATTNKDFRLPFREILCLRCKSLNSVMREDFYQSQYGDQQQMPTSAATAGGAAESQHLVVKKHHVATTSGTTSAVSSANAAFL